MARGDQAESGGSLRVANVSRAFGAAPAVQDVSFSIAAGSFATILGPSGCGKTTLLRMIAGLIAPDHGHIVIDGADMARVAAHRRNIGVVFQRLALFPHLTAAANIAYPLRMRGVAAGERDARVRAALQLVRLEGFGDRRLHALSGGQQQRVAIARALVFRPRLLLLDEPLAALDRNLREEMQAEFKRIQHETGVTAINVTHDQNEALRLSDQVLVMQAGRIVQDAPPREVWANPATLFVAGFIGAPNIIPHQGRMAVLRPEAVALGPAALSCAQRFEGHVTAIDFEGATTLLSLASDALPGLTLRARSADTAQRPGDAVAFGWNDSDLRLFPAPAPTRTPGVAA